jgi:hypothetical protein
VFDAPAFDVSKTGQEKLKENRSLRRNVLIQQTRHNFLIQVLYGGHKMLPCLQLEIAFDLSP